MFLASRSPVKGGETVFPNVPAASLTVLPTVTPEKGTNTSKEPPRQAGKGDAAGGSDSKKSGSSGKTEKGKAGEVDYGGGDLFDIRADNLRRQALAEQGPAAAPAGALATLARAAGLGSAPAPAPSSCDDRAGGLRISPKPGDAVVFWYVSLGSFTRGMHCLAGQLPGNSTLLPLLEHAVWPGDKTEARTGGCCLHGVSRALKLAWLQCRDTSALCE